MNPVAHNGKHVFVVILYLRTSAVLYVLHQICIVKSNKNKMADRYGGESSGRPFTGQQQQRPPTAATDTNAEDYFEQARPTTSSRGSVPPRRPSFSGTARPTTSGRPMTSMVSRPGTAQQQQGVPEWLFQGSRLIKRTWPLAIQYIYL